MDERHRPCQAPASIAGGPDARRGAPPVGATGRSRLADGQPVVWRRNAIDGVPAPAREGRGFPAPRHHRPRRQRQQGSTCAPATQAGDGPGRTTRQHASYTRPTSHPGSARCTCRMHWPANTPALHANGDGNTHSLLRSARATRALASYVVITWTKKSCNVQYSARARQPESPNPPPVIRCVTRSRRT